ncbi:transporter substrate-binding domain-containing protein [Thorsellia anophelis]|uniref:Polar amino acid transport system substrate-binding protein n=1 Tax=Thorsellia anophelis DSM 18579 TaxID=1123402 RepID=A0A1I0ELS9_9GAMM|nr:transporter substrate-binding domain-containing protein [Thorsellia anophelis]SET46138.1 polar amino acid transport system substrate-binding protein [Thorsellia anophelis DSM 18579]
MKKGLIALSLLALSFVSEANLDIKAQEIPIVVEPVPSAIALIPKDFNFIEPGTLTVAIAANNAPPIAFLASNNRDRIGSDVDFARLLAGSLGLKVNIIPAAWEDWPLGITSGRYDVALVNIAVTEPRKEKFDFATYRADSLAFTVKANSAIESIQSAEDISGLRVIVQSGTNQEKILLGWNEINEQKGLEPALLVYVADDASADLFIQSGRADVWFGPQSVAAYKAALTGKTKVVGFGPKKALVAVTTKKGNGLVNALQASINAAIENGTYQTILARFAEQDEAVLQSEINPPGITY